MEFDPLNDDLPNRDDLQNDKDSQNHDDLLNDEDLQNHDDLLNDDEVEQTSALNDEELKIPNVIQIIKNFIQKRGWNESVLRITTGATSLVLIFVVLWVMNNFYFKSEIKPTQEVDESTAIATDIPDFEQPPIVFPTLESAYGGITRLAQGHTNLPAQPRYDVKKYTVEVGDTIFGIAEKYNLRPETIFWANYYTLADDVHNLSPGQELNILPLDGVYYEWHAGDGLNGVAEFYGVTPEDIINFEGNHLSMDTIGEYAAPNIEPGTWLVIPNGTREFITWTSPRITRDDPAVAKIMGPGYCGTVTDGPVGNGSFIWPSVETYLSGYDYTPELNHYGIDIAGNEGYAIFAVDNGVVVYAGWNDWGYGNVIVVDHGNGWQSLYAHLSALNVGCGSYVYQGDIIAALGNTGNSSGPHLHFELRSDTYGKVNPWNFLQY